ncbi:MAG: cation transporter [Deltaproteobacteria bacterium]|nr:cation transporter [Deltaproteobacteria bacterium]
MTTSGQLRDAAGRGAAACLRCGVRFAWMNLAVSTALAGLKAAVGLLCGSQALLASSLYSLNDVLSALAVLASLKLARRPADAAHPYGHGKVEFMAIAGVSVVLCLSVLLMLHSIVAIAQGSASPPRLVALLVAVLSAGAMELLARQGFCVARQLDSPALHTCAEHNRSDTISSLGAVVGIAAAYFGLHVVDRAVAVLEILDVMRLAGGLLGRSLNGLMDRALPGADLVRLRSACVQVPGVSAVRSLRSRRSGSEVWVDLVVSVAAGQSVGQAHRVAEQVRAVVGRTLGQSVQAQVAFRGDGPARADAEAVAAHA